MFCIVPLQAAHQVGLAAVKLHRQSRMEVSVLDRLRSQMDACLDKAKLRMQQARSSLSKSQVLVCHVVVSVTAGVGRS